MGVFLTVLFFPESFWLTAEQKWPYQLDVGSNSSSQPLLCKCIYLILKHASVASKIIILNLSLVFLILTLVFHIILHAKLILSQVNIDLIFIGIGS